MRRALKISFLSTRWTLPLAVAILVGCGSSDGTNRGSVTGNVTLDSQPVEEGSIMFVPTGGTSGPMSFVSVAGGKYSISAGDRGPVVGKHKVQIEGYRDTGTRDDGGAALKDQIIPAKYNAQTTLVVEVAKGANTHNFELTSQ